MSFELPALPYAKDALAPHISAETARRGGSLQIPIPVANAA